LGHHLFGGLGAFPVVPAVAVIDKAQDIDDPEGSRLR
jgi:hypothetical protein